MQEPSVYFFQLGLAATLVGLVLFASNFRRMLENILVFLLFFWDKKFIRIVLRKNLKAHYNINRLLSIIYALIFCQFILTAISFNIAAKEFNTSFQAYNLADIIAVKQDNTYFNYNATDYSIKTYSYNIKSFAYLPKDLAYHQKKHINQKGDSAFYIEDAMKVNKIEVRPFGLQPSEYFDSALNLLQSGYKT